MLRDNRRAAFGHQLVEAPGGDRHLLVVVAQHEGPGGALELEPARLQFPAVVVAQERQQQDRVRMAVPLVRCAPVHVEIAGVDAGWPVLEDIPPPPVVPRCHGHVVGHDVEYLAKPGFAQRLLQLGVALLAAQLVIDGGRVDHVVAVGAALCRLEHRGEVNVAHAEVRQVPGNGGRVGEIEAGVQLQPVRSPPWRPLGLASSGCGGLVVHRYSFYISWRRGG